MSAGPFQWEVVGIVDDVHQYGLDQNPDPQVFFDIRQLPSGNPSPYFAVRTQDQPIALVSNIRSIVRELNPAATVDNLATMDQVISNSMSRPRLVAVLLGMFAGIAGLLALVGVYGLITYSVAGRTREFGIRLALGATRGRVIRLVLGESALLIGVGLVTRARGSGGTHATPSGPAVRAHAARPGHLHRDGGDVRRDRDAGVLSSGAPRDAGGAGHGIAQ